jgi:DNA modification methylase
LRGSAEKLQADVITGDASQLSDFGLPTADYVLTSPPYWNMLHARGAESQHKRRSASDKDVVYSGDPADLGNISDYNEFIDRLFTAYVGLHPYIRPRSYLTIIVKNVKKGCRIYPLAWDLARRLGEVHTLRDERILCQDDVRLALYGLGNAWVNNTFHH